MSSEIDFLDLNVEGAVEPSLIEDDNEHLVEIVKVKYVEADEEEGTSARIDVLLECPEDEASRMFSHALWIPNKEDTKKQRNSAKWAIKSFKDAFGISSDSKMDFPSWIGLQTFVVLGVRSSEGYDDQNKVRKFLGQGKSKKAS